MAHGCMQVMFATKLMVATKDSFEQKKSELKKPTLKSGLFFSFEHLNKFLNLEMARSLHCQKSCHMQIQMYLNS